MLEYTGHSLMKENVAIIKKRSRYQCQKCGIIPKYTRELHAHHIDGYKWNHELNNLLVVCEECHKRIHKNKKDGSFVGEYRNKDIILKKIEKYRNEIERLKKFL